MEDDLTGRPALGTVLAVADALATVRLFLPGGGVVEATLPAVAAHTLMPGATVVAIFLAEAPASGVVVGALAGATLVAAHTHTAAEVPDLAAATQATVVAMLTGYNAIEVDYAVESGLLLIGIADDGIGEGLLAGGAVSNPKLAAMAAGTIKGRALGGGDGMPEDLTPAQAAAIVGTAAVTFQDAVTLAALPTSDPHVVGRVWNSGGTVKVSAG
jgi:hypothetical protein